MKKIVLCVLGTAFAMILWAAAVLLGTLNGWLHQPIAKRNAAPDFITATEAEIDKQFVGNFAMVTFKKGAIESEKYHSAGKSTDRNTVFQVSSLSKWISAVGVMKLVEAGKLDLDAPVSNYLTRWQLTPSEFNNDEVTVRRLLSHTAGLTDGLGYSGYEPGKPAQSIEQSLTKASDADEGISGAVHVGRKPGSAFTYSGGGYTLLQLVVEEVSGQPFAVFMHEAVFQPLGMVHSTYVWKENSPYTLAEFYHKDGTKYTPRHYTALAATSLYTSLSDLALFFQAHLKGPQNEPIGRGVLTPATMKRMREAHGQEMGVAIWGLGPVLYATTDDNDFIIGHDGKSTPPINTAVRLNPATGDGIIILETGSPTIATRLASEWVFWKTGKVDTFLFPMLLPGMTKTIGIGWLVLIISVITYFTWKRWWIARQRNT